jgi:hypothetical protein
LQNKRKNFKKSLIKVINNNKKLIDFFKKIIIKHLKNHPNNQGPLVIYGFEGIHFDKKLVVFLTKSP